MAKLITENGLSDFVESDFIFFYESGFKNFAENRKIMEHKGFKIALAMELVIDKAMYEKEFGAPGIYHDQ